MAINQPAGLRSEVFKGHVSRYAILGLVISISSICLASFLVAFQAFGAFSIEGFLHAQRTSPAVWALDLTPFMFAYWGQSFCHELANKAENIIENKIREFSDKSEALESRLKYESYHDHLTHLPNTRLFTERMSQCRTQLQANEQMAVILLNISNLKEVNYHFGTYNANSILLQFAEKLKTILLEPYMLQAYMGMNMVARLQGAAFGILIPRLRKEHHLKAIVTKIVTDTSVDYMMHGNTVSLKTTAGVALSPLHGEETEHLLHRAGLSVSYAEKEEKPYEIYDPRMDKNAKVKQKMLKEIGVAIENQEISVCYQPICSLTDERALGAQVMITLAHPDFSQLSEDKLSSLIEGTHYAKDVNLFMLTRAIEQLKLAHQEGHSIFLAVNLFSPIDPELPTILEKLLAINQVASEFLKIGVTEKFCLSDQTRSLRFLTQIHQLGAKIFISDFCSGYSSFVYLVNFPISEIKIDKAFTFQMTDPKKLKIVHAMVTLAKEMGLLVCADGIHDKAIADELSGLACSFGQGHYFSALLDEPAFIAYVKNLH